MRGEGRGNPLDAFIRGFNISALPPKGGVLAVGLIPKAYLQRLSATRGKFFASFHV